ncbi:MAG: ABC transporter ATP-binding protein [Methermicoccaceae archaeon]
MDAVRVESLKKEYMMGTQSVEVLKGIDLSIEEGEFVAIMGRSGSGKSTLLNMLGCLDRPTSGEVYMDGVAVSSHTDSELAHIRGEKVGFVFQTFNLIARMSARENVEMPMVYRGVSSAKRRRRAEALLSQMGLEDRASHKPPVLSGGERQRVAIARALANEPTLILADEPTGNLDSKTGKGIMDIFSELNGKGVTIVMVTHDAEVAKYAHRKVVLSDGLIES